MNPLGWLARLANAARGDRVVMSVAGTAVHRAAPDQSSCAIPPGDSVEVSEALASACVALLPAARRWARRRVELLVGPPFAEVRRIRGLPLVRDRAALRAVLVQDPSRYLPRRLAGWQVSEVELAGLGEVVVALLAPEVVAASVALRDGNGVGGVEVAPLLEALAYDAASPAQFECDGEVHALYAGDAGLQPVVAAVPCAATPPAAPHAVPPLASWTERLRLRYTPPRAPSPRGGARLPAIAATLSLLAWAAAGPVRDQRTMAALETERRRLARVEVEVHRHEARLRDANLTLAVAEEFGRRRRPVLALLAELAERLPRPGALMAIRTDSLGGSLAALTPPGELATTALPASLVDQGEVVGPVTREVVGGRDVERSSVRFTWTASLRMEVPR